jgi:arylformamidase
MALIDISRPIAPDTAVWPGDQPVEWRWTTRLHAPEGPAVNLGALRMSTHTATHADAPLHTEADGASIDALPLSSFVGPAQVVDAGPASEIRPEHVPASCAKRLLFRTRASALAPDEWPERIAPLLPATVERCADCGVRLVGTDAPSVDPLSSSALPAHHALIEAGIVTLEGLDLHTVSPGSYVLLALPLKLPGGDAAPVRAVLQPPT